MKTLKILLAEKAELIKQLDSLLEVENFTKEQSDKFDTIKEKVELIKKQIEIAEMKEHEELVSASNAFNAKTEQKETKEFTKETKVEIVNANFRGEKLEKGEVVGSYVRSMLGAKSFGISIEEYAKKAYGERHPVNNMIKTLVANSGSGIDSSIVSDPLSAELVPLLRNAMVVRQLQPREIVVPSGRIAFPRQTGSVTASYIAENTALNASDATFDQIALELKKIMAVTSVSKELLNYGVFGVDSIIRDDMVQSLARTADAQLLLGVSSATKPASIDSLINASNSQASAGATLANVDADLQFLIYSLKANNARMQRCKFVMNPRSVEFLKFLRDGNGNIAYPEVKEGMLCGYPILETNAIPVNLGTGTNESSIYFIDGGELFFGEGRRMDLQSSDVASIQVSGSLQSMFAQDAVGYKIIAEHDLNCGHDVAMGSKISAVVWGA